MDLLEKRPPGSSICPSEAAKRVDPEAWRGLMDAARMAAARLSANGDARVTQSGREVDPSSAKGSIRIARADEHAR